MKPAGTFEIEFIKVSSIDPQEIENPELQDVDITKLIHAFSIKESVTSGYLSGEIKVYDTAGIFYNLPLRGQELLSIKLKDFYEQEYFGDFFVYSIDQLKPIKKGTDAGLEYTLKIVSIGKFISERYTIRRCIANGGEGSRQYLPISEQVQILYDDYYLFRVSSGITTKADEKGIRITETDGEQQIVIPYLSPDDAMHLLSRRAHSETYPSDMFRFFETRETYHFSNLEELMDPAVAGLPVKTFVYNAGGTDNSPEAELKKMTGVVDLDLGEAVNTFRVLKEGGYFTSYTAIDLANRYQSTFEYDHEEEMLQNKKFKYTDLQNPSGTKIRFNHTSSFINLHLNDRKRVFGIKDYPEEDAAGSAPALRPNPSYGDIINSKKSNLSQFDEYTLNIMIYGDLKITPGKMILLDIPEFTGETQRTREERSDQTRSGVYMVTDVVNKFYETAFYQQLTLIKSGLSDNG